MRGFTLIELMIVVAILAILSALGLPLLTESLQKNQIRTAAESVMAGVQLARAEAIRRNALVRFQLVTSIASSCALSASGPAWIVSQDDPTSKCDIDPSDTTDPRTIQKKPGGEGSPNATLSATAAGAAATTVTFNGMGRMSGAGGIDTIDIENPIGGTCQHAAADGRMRCLRLRIASGGEARLCDPKVTDAADPRYC